MSKGMDTDNKTVTIDDSSTELFASFQELVPSKDDKKLLSFIPSFFTTASLPFKNINRNVFIRKGSQGITLTLNSPKNVPYGKYGRLLLSILTTHAVLSKEKNQQVTIEYDSLSQLLREMQLPRQRGKDIQEQLECFKAASFSFEQKVEERKQGYLFEHMYEPGEKLPRGEVTIRTVSTGTILFTEGVQYQEIVETSSKNPKVGNFKIVLSDKFAAFCQKHAVPIDYSIYKDITSPVGKDIYAWLVFRNNGLSADKPVFIPRNRLVEQFMPVSEESDPKIANVNYSRIIDQIKEIKQKYYPDLKVEIDKDGSGITLFKSPTPVLKEDIRYALITSEL